MTGITRKAIMAMLAAVSILAFASPGFAATYYVDSSAGNDANTGASTSAPWKTLDKINGRSFAAGDNILLKRGATWRGYINPVSSGASGSPITFGAYGAGDRPKILGSINKSLTSDWTLAGSNIWYAAAPVDIGNMIFNNEASCGVKCANKTGLDVQGEFWYDGTNKRAYMYSSSNPASYYQVIECAQNDMTTWARTAIINVEGRNYLTFQDLDLRYGGNLGIHIKNNAGNIIVQNCDISYIGGGYQGAAGRLGNAIQYWGAAHDCIVRYCHINQVYDAAITPQYDGAPASALYFKNLFFYYNVIENCEYSFEFWYKDRNVPVKCSCDNIRFENNVCKDAGFGWSHTQRPDPSGRHMMFFSSYANMTNIFIRNNIFDGSRLSCLYKSGTEFNGWSGITIDYNTYYMSGGDSQMFRFANASYSMSQFSTYKTAQGKDAHSKAADPLFVNPAAGDYHLKSTSPCIDGGTSAGLLKDYSGSTVYTGGGVDIGAFEYAAAATPPPATIAPPGNLRFQ